MHHIDKANTQAFHTGSVDLLPFIPQLGARSKHKSRMDTVGGITREEIRSCVDILDNVIPAQYGEVSKYILIHRAEANQIMIAAEKAVKNNHRKKIPPNTSCRCDRCAATTK